MKREIEIPKNECPGCAGRDEIIRGLSEEVDRLQSAKQLASEVLSEDETIQNFEDKKAA